MLESVLRELNNWFEADKLAGSFVISGGRIVLPHGWLKGGQYFRILGSVFNDGLHLDNEFLHDEEFEGTVYALAIPTKVIELSEKIGSWIDSNESAIRSPYSSQSDNGTSVTLAQGSSGAYSWSDAFRADLRKWRKL